jgi:hypothetical protein
MCEYSILPLLNGTWGFFRGTTLIVEDVVLPYRGTLV